MSNLLAAVMLVNDATTTINTLLPLIKQAIEEGREPTDEELKLASMRLGIKIQVLDDEINKN